MRSRVIELNVGQPLLSARDGGPLIDARVGENANLQSERRFMVMRILVIIGVGEVALGLEGRA
jgi:hypothetical protein